MRSLQPWPPLKNQRTREVLPGGCSSSFQRIKFSGLQQECPPLAFLPSPNADLIPLPWLLCASNFFTKPWFHPTKQTPTSCYPHTLACAATKWASDGFSLEDLGSTSALRPPECSCLGDLHITNPSPQEKSPLRLGKYKHTSPPAPCTHPPSKYKPAPTVYKVWRSNGQEVWAPVKSMSRKREGSQDQACWGFDKGQSVSAQAAGHSVPHWDSARADAQALIQKVWGAQTCCWSWNVIVL